MVADEQLHPEAFLQAFDGRGNRRLGDVKLARSLRHATGFYRGDEVLELSQGIAATLTSLAPAWAHGNRDHG